MHTHVCVCIRILPLQGGHPIEAMEFLRYPILAKSDGSPIPTPPPFPFPWLIPLLHCPPPLTPSTQPFVYPIILLPSCILSPLAILCSSPHPTSPFPCMLLLCPPFIPDSTSPPSTFSSSSSTRMHFSRWLSSPIPVSCYYSWGCKQPMANVKGLILGGVAAQGGMPQK